MTDALGERADDLDDPGQGAWAKGVRNETEYQRLDRNFLQLLQELRVAHTGVQILFAFLLTLVFQPRFTRLGTAELALYGVTVTAAAVAMALLIAPVASHRLLFRRRAMGSVVDLAHRATLAGLVALFVAVEGSLLLACAVAFGWSWAAVPTLVFGAVVLLTWVVLPIIHRRSNGVVSQPSA